MRSAVLAALLALAGCATAYGDRNWAGYGVEAAPMGGQMYRVTARLNDVSTEGQLQDYLMLKAAETAQANGAAGFEIVSTQAHTRTGGVSMPGTSNTTASGFTTYSPGAFIPLVEPSGTLTIRLISEAQPDNPAYIDASTVIAAIAPRVQRPRQ